MIPGWPYSLVPRWTGPDVVDPLLDAVPLGPDDDLAAVTAAQVRGVIGRSSPPGTGTTATRTSW